ncbi:hypothetical protein Cgig2_017127 [Carnegiea gigantea]|uniref:Uncharacterized protein n=1 Tax=Carnegiea gigantea TaxID=171969 RepID=A0A9Q1GKN6_9CARY|nr:hypothetical protein Cgig2_017127 [Carnegiea gigantea]
MIVVHLRVKRTLSVKVVRVLEENFNSRQEAGEPYLVSSAKCGGELSRVLRENFIEKKIIPRHYAEWHQSGGTAPVTVINALHSPINFVHQQSSHYYPTTTSADLLPPPAQQITYSKTKICTLKSIKIASVLNPATMADGEEPMRAANANELENAVNDNKRRNYVVTITYKRKSRTLVSEAEGERQGKAHNKESEPHNNDDQMSQSTEYTVPPKPEPASKKQRKQHHRDSLQPTTKRAPKITTKKKVQFRHIEVEEPVERSFPTAINWDTDKVRNRDKEEQEAGEYGKGRIIARIDYERIVCLAEADLEIYMQELEEDQPQQGGAGAMSRATTTKEQRCPYCPHCNAQHDGIVHCNDEPLQSTDKAGGDDNVRDCSTPDDPYYYSPEFLEQVDKLESMAIERMGQRTRMGCSPLSFNLGLSPEREAYAIPS